MCGALSIQPPQKSHTQPLPHFILQERAEFLKKGVWGALPNPPKTSLTLPQFYSIPQAKGGKITQEGAPQPHFIPETLQKGTTNPPKKAIQGAAPSLPPKMPSSAPFPQPRFSP